LIAAGVDVNFVDYNRDSFLFIAARHGHLKVVRTLVYHGVDIHEDSDSVIPIASQYGHWRISECLIKNGSNIHRWANHSLVYSCKNNHIKTAEFLLNQGLDINKFDFGWDIITLAKNRSFKAIEMLLQRRGDVEYNENECANIIYAVRKAKEFGYNDIPTCFSILGKTLITIEIISNDSHYIHSIT
jgi:ankyrin repeat protein